MQQIYVSGAAYRASRANSRLILKVPNATTISSIRLVFGMWQGYSLVSSVDFSSTLDICTVHARRYAYIVLFCLSVGLRVEAVESLRLIPKK